MKRIWLCAALVAGILLLTGYGTHRVRSFAGEVAACLEAAEQALEGGDLPAEITAQVPVAETVIVGSVPGTYVELPALQTDGKS